MVWFKQTEPGNKMLTLCKVWHYTGIIHVQKVSGVSRTSTMLHYASCFMVLIWLKVVIIVLVIQKALNNQWRNWHFVCSGGASVIKMATIPALNRCSSYPIIILPQASVYFYVSKQPTLNDESSVILVWKSASLASESKVQSMGMGDDMVCLVGNFGHLNHFLCASAHASNFIG